MSITTVLIRAPFLTIRTRVHGDGFHTPAIRNTTRLVLDTAAKGRQARLAADFCRNPPAPCRVPQELRTAVGRVRHVLTARAVAPVYSDTAGTFGATVGLRATF